ncbi:MAG TPA: hypothetical protein VH763_10285 [Gemmatimonadales bacterium]|jgi:hypothetical protein
MPPLKERVLREFGDQGADTIERYWAQIEYTAFWCIRLLLPSERLQSVIAEGIEDVVVVREVLVELRQVKTRDESVGSWTTAELLDILVAQYSRGMAFSTPHSYHLVSNGVADNRIEMRPTTYGPLYRLKHLLELHRAGESLSDTERADLDWFINRLCPVIQERLENDYRQSIDTAEARALLLNTCPDSRRRLEDPGLLAPSALLLKADREP